MNDSEKILQALERISTQLDRIYSIIPQRPYDFNRSSSVKKSDTESDYSGVRITGYELPKKSDTEE
jgi:hypothetical protein